MVGKVLLGIILLIVPIQASAQRPAHAATTTETTEPTLLVNAEDWQALAIGADANRVCYVAQAGRVRSALGKQDMRPLLYVTHRPARQTFDVVAFAAAYDFRRDSMARVAFTNGPTHRLFTQGSFAWAGDEQNDRRLVRAMVDSSAMTVIGLGSDGHLHEDTVSLKG
ncbi:MAG TPA: hypothetical protein VEC14_13500, partial [Reyranellaceae bacterium]|nr:hypothetical protein [Reyranellaceae bacterium]